MWRGKNVNAGPDDVLYNIGFQDYGHAVGFVQYMLRRLGFYQGPVTEHFNQWTEEALKHFQMSQHQPITGRMDHHMWTILIGVAVHQQILQNEVGPQFVNHFTVAQMG